MKQPIEIDPNNLNANLVRSRPFGGSRSKTPCGESPPPNSWSQGFHGSIPGSEHSTAVSVFDVLVVLGVKRLAALGCSGMLLAAPAA